jgi:hypothetical protein
VEDRKLDARVCPIHGPQSSYQSSCGNGPQYPSSVPRKSPNSEALALLRSGVSLKETQRRTGHNFKSLQRWRAELLRAREVVA